MSRFKTVKTPKSVNFCGVQVEIFKLSVQQVLEIQEMNKVQTEDSNGMELLVKVIGFGCPEVGGLSREELFELPMEELGKLSNEVLKYSGLAK